MLDKIEIGGDLWQGVVPEDLDSGKVEIVAQAYADFLSGNIGTFQKVLVGYSDQDGPDEVAWNFAKILSNNGISVDIIKEVCPVFAFSFYIKERGYGGGVIASRDGCGKEHVTVRFRAPYGGAIRSDVTRKLNYYMHMNRVRRRVRSERRIKELGSVLTEYFERVRSIVDFDSIRKLEGPIVFDLKGGLCSESKMKEFFSEIGVNIIFIHDTPEGVRKRETYGAGLTDLVGEVRRWNAKFGIAFDPSGGFVGLVDEEGNSIDGNVFFPLLYGYLMRTRMVSGDVVKTVSTSDLIRQMVVKYGGRVYEVPVSDQCIVEKMLESEAEFAFDDKGGVVLKVNVYEKDGVVTALLLMEMISYYGMGLSELVNSLFMKYGRYYYRRMRVEIAEDVSRRVLNRLMATPPVYIGEFRVNSVFLIDGVKFCFDGGNYLLVRQSNQPGLIEVYSGGQDEDEVCKLIEYGERIFVDDKIVKFHVPIKRAF